MVSLVEKQTTGLIEQVTETRSGNAVDDKDQLDRERARQLAIQYVPDSPEEKAIVRKLDWRLVVS